MRLLALMENVRDFAGNRVTRAPRALRPVQLTQVITISYGTHYNTYKKEFASIQIPLAANTSHVKSVHIPQDLREL